MKQLLCSAAFGFALALALTTTAVAQGNPGPDVICSDVGYNINNYSAQGGIDAFSFGTKSCNIGTAVALWQAAPDPDHPVIAQHMYRYYQGKFEMIGQSWLKHSFATINDGTCGSCDGNLGSVLGLGCSDPYGAGLNGSQSGLGPKFEINAHLGTNPGSYTGQGMTGNSIYKRLQVPVADLGLPGAKYFVEGMYVTADDAAVGNQDNNASYREVTFTGGPSNYNCALVGPATVQQLPAIYAWKAEDPDVQINAVRIPGEGLVNVGYKGTDLGGGLWNYEFAVHNMNSDRSVGSFKVSFPSGAMISAIGFNDVRYHSGEPFADTDWSATVNSDNIIWSTDSFATDPDANALRWGTTYNFRFTSSIAPTGLPVNVELGIFKPGTPNVVPTSFAPQGDLVASSGGDQAANSGEAFAQPLVARLTDAFGQGIPGANVTFSKVTGAGSVTFPNGGVAVTDANGYASIIPTAGGTAGPAIVEATDGQDTVSFDLYVQKLNLTWVPGAAVLVFNAQIGWPSNPVTLAVDDSSIPPLETIYGTLYTSILAPLPSFYAETGDPTAPYGYRATLVTNSAGAVTQVYSGLQAFVGSGISLNHQAYALRFNQGNLEVYISNNVVNVY